MTYSRRLPDRYKPPASLNLCSNVLEAVEIPLEVFGQPALLIGAGRVPLIWLAAPANPGSHELEWIVKESLAANPAIDLDIDADARAVAVWISGEPALQAHATKGLINVPHLDLRPTGLNVFGNAGGLQIGGTSLTANRFRNLSVAFALR